MEKQSKVGPIIKLVLILAATVAFIILGVNNMSNIKLGLDLAGGVSITYEATEANPDEVDMADTIYKLQKRAEGYSSEAAVYQEGANRVNIDIPGVSDANAILEELGKPGSLQFMTCLYDDSYTFTGFGEEVLSGPDIKTAGVVKSEGQAGESDGYEVQLILNDEGAEKFAKATSENIGKQIAIIYDNNVVSMPVVNSAITGGQASITGNFDYDSAMNLASTIRLGALKLELTEARSNVVGARLGEQAIPTSIKAGIIGLIAVMILMIVLYRVAGLASSIALAMYTGLSLILIDAFEITLTLPGIAGIVLSIGMAVDANVIIFTRIKEELGLQNNVHDAIKAGFNKALSAIVDGNITTLIAAVVLYFRGSGTIKGFAQTLALGIVLSMVTALFISRAIITALYELGCDKPSMYGTKKPVEKAFDFVGKRKISYAISIALIAIGIVVMVINNGSTGDPLNYDIDFKGGTSTDVTFNEDLSLDYISENVSPVVTEATGEMSPQIQKVAGTNEVLIRTMSLDAEKREALNNALVENFGVDKEKITAENISGSISSEMRNDALWAVVLATILMLIYIWFRFKNIFFASSAVLALVHDVLVTITAYAVCKWAVGSTFIACMLTIVGYSINATIVIFDRIRENLKEAVNPDVKEIVNRSITETFTRSIFTSLTTLIMVVSLYIFGVSSIKEFALPLMVGVICGAYSSVCVTGPLWYGFNLHKKPAKKTEEE